MKKNNIARALALTLTLGSALLTSHALAQSAAPQATSLQALAGAITQLQRESESMKAELTAFRDCNAQGQFYNAAQKTCTDAADTKVRECNQQNRFYHASSGICEDVVAARWIAGGPGPAPQPALNATLAREYILKTLATQHIQLCSTSVDLARKCGTPSLQCAVLSDAVETKGKAGQATTYSVTSTLYRCD